MNSFRTEAPMPSMPVKRVVFATYSSVIVTRPKTADELKSVWWSRKEMKGFKSKAQKSANKLLKTNPAAAKEYIRNSFEVNKSILKFSGVESFCGLEHLLCEDVSNMLLACRQLTLKRVLEEQKRQEETGAYCEHMIARYLLMAPAFRPYGDAELRE